MPHLTSADRSETGNALRSNRRFSAIARSLEKARSTVMRETLSHRVPSDKGANGHVTNRCIKPQRVRQEIPVRAMRPSHEQDEMQLLLEMQLRLPRHIKVRFIRPVRLIPPKKVPRRTDGRIASRKGATLQNLTQRLTWGGRSGGKNMRNRMHDLRK